MVKFLVDLAKPGLPNEHLAGGFEKLSGAALLLIGPEKIQFQLPIKHLTWMSFFDKAFNGNFKEGDTKTMEMPEDDPAAFRLFIRWLYRGIDDPMSLTDSIETWIRLLIMSGKWCFSSDFGQNVVKHIHNLANSLVGSSFQSLRIGYDMAQNHAYRFVFVHAAWVHTRKYEFSSLVKWFEKESGVFRDYCLWSELLRRVIRNRKLPDYRYEEHLLAPETEAHFLDRVLGAVIFPDHRELDLFRGWGQWDEEDETGGPWQELAEYLDI